MEKGLCSNKPCDHGTCQETDNDNYTCSCEEGYHGKHCQLPMSYCQLWNPCLNGGSCRDFNFFYECDCSIGFFGQNCSESKIQILWSWFIVGKLIIKKN